jgi:hypothetical protein
MRDATLRFIRAAVQRHSWLDESGQTLVEYALILALLVPILFLLPTPQSSPFTRAAGAVAHAVFEHHGHSDLDCPSGVTRDGSGNITGCQ